MDLVQSPAAWPAGLIAKTQAPRLVVKAGNIDETAVPFIFAVEYFPDT